MGPVLIMVIVVALVVLVFLGSYVSGSRRYEALGGRLRRAYLSGRRLKGKTAVVATVLDPEGRVLFKGGDWTAISEEGRLEPGEVVTIERVDGSTLYVTRKQKSK